MALQASCAAMQGPKQAAALPASMQPLGSAPGSQAGSRAGSLSSTAVAPAPPPCAEAEAKAPKAAPAPEKAPGAKPKRESIVVALRKMIEGLDTDEDYDVKLDKVGAFSSLLCNFGICLSACLHSSCVKKVASSHKRKSTLQDSVDVSDVSAPSRLLSARFGVVCGAGVQQPEDSL